jgi:hypothetical protein
MNSGLALKSFAERIHMTKKVVASGAFAMILLGAAAVSANA